MKISKAAVLAFAAMFAAALHAQVSETIEVRITSIDAVVTDRAGNPVHGLTKDDFEIVENGKPQEITNFSEIREGVAAQGEAPAQKEALTRRIVVFVDNSSIHPHARTQALQAFEQSLDRLMRAGDQVTLTMWNNKLEVLVPLTSDRATLLEAMRVAAKKSSGSFNFEAQKQAMLENARNLMNASMPGERGGEPGRVPDSKPTPTIPPPGSGGGGGGGFDLKVRAQSIRPEEAYARSMDAARTLGEQLWLSEKSLINDLRRTIDTLAGLEGKKVLLYLGSELSEEPGLELAQRIDSMWSQNMRGLQRVVARESRSLTVELRGLAQHANAHGVTMYMVDTSRATRGASNDASEGSIDRATAEPLSDGATLRAMSNVAQTTGGVAMPGGKTINTALNTIVNDLSFYYSLGYRTTGDSVSNRNVQVRVKNPAYRIRSRSSYIEKSVADTARERLAANLFQDVVSDFDVTVAASAPEKQPDGRSRVMLTVKFPTSITLVPKGENLEGQFGVLLVTGKPDGRMSQVSSDVQTLSFPKTARRKLEQQKTFEYTVPLLVGAGEVIVSVGITDQVAGSAGFAKTKIVVP